MDTPAPDPKKPSGAPPADFARFCSVALALGQIPWFYIVVSQPIPLPLAAWNIAVAIAVLGLATFAWARAPWVAGPATVIGWYGAGFSAWWAIQVETPVLFGAAFFSALAALWASQWQTSLPQVRRERITPKAPEHIGPWVRENFEAIIVAFIMALIIRCFCIEVFKIPSSSMEPTLLGDFRRDHPSRCDYPHYHRYDNGGDRIMVTKYFYAFVPVDRYDVMVFKFPLNQARNFIKRVVGLPGEELMISAGDLWTRPAGSTNPEGWTIARKPPRVQDSIWITETVDYFDDLPTFETFWKPDRPAAHAVEGGVLSSLEANGRRDIQFNSKSEFDDVGDIRIAFSFDLTGPGGEVYADITNGHGRFEAILSTEGPGSLRYYPPGRRHLPPKDTLSIPSIAAGKPHTLDLAVWDGLALLRVDGVVAGRKVFLDTGDPTISAPASGSPIIAFGARGVTFRVDDLFVGRDIYYRGKNSRGRLGEHVPLKIPKGHYVVMGDNTCNSHDSRAWMLWTYRLKDGRVIECEGQETSDTGGEALREEVRKELGLEETPDLAIKADKHGRMHALSWEEVLEGRDQDPVPFRTVEGKFIVGRAFWVWWPRGRWFRLIK